ncbi:MAG TPA: DUF72 domain-containing protein [Solirubrobacterales bacterium]|nr:DUF72 domain-containing protein [Solirubrobacterales bacterium]
MKAVRIGCAGWANEDWRGVLYPEGMPKREWLAAYARELSTVEVNSTFYRLPSEAAVKGWVEETPDAFSFAVKASRYITHVKRLLKPETYVERFLGSIEPLRAAGKLGAVLWQLPPSFKRDDERLDAALAVITARAPGRHCVEFRNQSWFTADVYDLLRARGAALVISDGPDLGLQARELTTDWTYLRMHRGARGRRGNYSAAELATWRRRIAAWRARAEVLVYFNNSREAFAIRNARTLAAGLR